MLLNVSFNEELHNCLVIRESELDKIINKKTLFKALEFCDDSNSNIKSGISALGMLALALFETSGTFIADKNA